MSPYCRPHRVRSLTVAAALAVLVTALVPGSSEPRVITLQTSAAVSASSDGAAEGNPVAAQCRSNGPYVWSHKVACGWPGAANTGPALSNCPQNRLTVRDGRASRTIHVTRDGAVLRCQDITGCLSIEARNVTIRDIAIRCTSSRTGENANGTAVIFVANGAGATIQRAKIDGMRGVHACVWHQGSRMAAVRINCRGVDDGIFSWADTGYSQTTGDHFTIKNSYFHDFTTRTANGHIDGYQTEGASHGLIQHNTFLMTSDADNESTSAIAIWNGRRSSSDILVRKNLIAGGGFAIYAQDYSPSESNPAGGFKVTDIRFVDNVFSKHLFDCVGYYGVWFPRGKPSDGWSRSGNYVLETGVKIDSRNPSSGGRLCD